MYACSSHPPAHSSSDFDNPTSPAPDPASHRTDAAPRHSSTASRRHHRPEPYPSHWRGTLSQRQRTAGSAAGNAWAVDAFVGGRLEAIDLLKITVRQINACGKDGTQAQACVLELDHAFRRRTGERVTPNAQVFGAWMAVLDRQGDVAGVRRVFDDMKHRQVPPDVIVYNRAIAACVAAGETDEASRLLCQMQAQGVTPDSLSFSPLITAHLKAGDLRTACSLASTMEAQRLSVPLSVHRALFHACSEQGNAWQAQQQLSMLKRSGLSPDADILESLVRTFTRVGRIDEALSHFKYITRQVRPHTHSYAVLVAALARRNRLDEARTLIEQLQARGERLTPAMRCALIQFHTQTGDMTTARQVWNDMKREGLAPTAGEASALITAWAHAGDLKGAIACFRAIRERRGPGDVCLHNALINAYNVAGDFRGAEKRFQRMLDRGIAPTQDTYFLMLARHELDGDVVAAWRWWNDMKDRGIRPDGRLYNVMIGAHEKAGQPAVSERLLKMAVKETVFRSNLGFIRLSNTLNFHCWAIETDPPQPKTCMSAATSAAIFRLLLKRQTINRHTTFAVGSHGGDAVGSMIRQCMRDAGWTPAHPVGRRGLPDTGCLIVTSRQ